MNQLYLKITDMRYPEKNKHLVNGFQDKQTTFNCLFFSFFIFLLIFLLQVCSSGSFGGGKTAEGVEESYPPCKAFDHNYQNLRTIGHGAFGFVVESLEQSTKTEASFKLSWNLNVAFFFIVWN